MQRRNLLRHLLGLSAVCITAALPAAALAKPGRPASPNSVAGSRRRRRRRHRRRVYRGLRVSALPYGCRVTRVRAGRTYYYCGGIWYRPVYQGTTVVYIVDDIDQGANTDVEFIILE